MTVADTVDFVAQCVRGPQRHDKVDRVEFNFVARVYRALEASSRRCAIQTHIYFTLLY